MQDAPQYLDASGNPITPRQAATMRAPDTLDASGNPLPSDVDQAGAEIEQNIAKYRRLGVPTDELGRPTRPLTLMEKFNDAISNPSPGAILGADLATAATGFLGGKGSIPSRTTTTPNAGDAVSVPRMLAKGIIKKTTGIDADAMTKQTAINELQATRMRLAAVKRQGRLNRLQPSSDTQTPQAPAPTPDTPPQAAPAPVDVAGRDLGGYAGPERRVTSAGPPEGVLERRAANAKLASSGGGRPKTATSPAETPPASVRRPSRASASAESATPPATPASTSAVDQLRSAGLQPPEIDQALRWLKAGVPEEQIVKRINATRALVGAKPILNQLPSLQQALDEVRHR